MSGDQDFMLTDEAGVPVGMLNLGVVRARGDQLAFDLAAVCDRSSRMRELLEAGMANGGSREFGFVAQAALVTLVEDVVHPLMVAAEQAGYPVRQCFEAEGARPPGAECPVCGHRSHALLELFGFQVQCSPTRSDDERDGVL